VETARLLLRPWQPDDLAEFTRLLTDPVVTRYIVVHTPFSPQDVADLSARTLEQWERNGFGPWAAIEKAAARRAGLEFVETLTTTSLARTRRSGTLACCSPPLTFRP
jgi:RimJ/RimL family protein N-acetyltransferase